ncbi:MAG: HtaA domain-containing protein [Thermoleophilaceae bacterium]|nr:HtaA domain-containing protein [Thermoleophilaceae bacterium]
MTAAPAADAAQPSGSPVATMPIGAAGKGLRSNGVSVTAVGTAKTFDTWVGFPVADVSVGAKRHASMIFSGGLKLRKGKSRASIRGLLVRLDGRTVTVTGKIGSRRITLFSGRASSAPKLDNARQSVELKVTRLRLTRNAAAAIKRRIRSFAPKSLTLGTLRVNAFVKSVQLGGDQTTTGEDARSCKPAASASIDPLKPPTAIDVNCAAVVWNYRDSWVSYIDDTVPVAPARGLPAIAGADHVCSDSGASRATTYSFSFPALSGWWDPVSGTGDLVSAGGVRSTGVRASVTIDIQLSDIQLKISGANSQLWATVLARSSTEPESTQRVLFATFDAASPMSGGPVGPGSALSRMRLTLTNDGSNAFKFYGAGDGFGCVDVGFNF